MTTIFLNDTEKDTVLLTLRLLQMWQMVMPKASVSGLIGRLCREEMRTNGSFALLNAATIGDLVVRLKVAQGDREDVALSQFRGRRVAVTQTGTERIDLTARINRRSVDWHAAGEGGA